MFIFIQGSYSGKTSINFATDNDQKSKVGYGPELTNAGGSSALSLLTNISLQSALDSCGLLARHSPMAVMASSPKLFPLSLRQVRPLHSSIDFKMSATID